MRSNPYIIVIALISAVALAFAGILLFLLPNSQQIVMIAQRKLMRAPTFSFDARFAVEPKGKSARVIADAIGTVARRGEELSSQERINLIWDGERRLAVAGELRVIDADAFFNPEQFSSSIAVPVAPDALVNVWLHVSHADLAATGLASFGAHELTSEEKQSFSQRAIKTPFFRFVRRVSGSPFGSAPYHYKAALQVIFLKDIAYRYRELRAGRPLEADEREAIDALFGSLAPGEADVWIGHDYAPQRVLLPFSYEGKDGDAAALLDISFSDLGRPAVIAAPTENVVEFGDTLAAIAPAIKARLPLSGVATRDSASQIGPSRFATGGVEDDADGDGLSEKLESFYRTDPKNPDTDGDGVSDGDEVARGTNPTGKGKLFDFGLPF